MHLTLPPSLSSAQPSPPVRIKVLGSPSASVAGQSTQLVRRQLRALLYRLAIAPTPVPRDHLCLLFWPDDLEESARRKLAVLINLLRRGLAPHDPIVAVEDSVSLDPAGVWIDVAAFSTGVRMAFETRQLGVLATAVELYNGPLLEGFQLPGNAEFEHWLLEERQYWEHQYYAALVSLIDGATALGDYQPAIVTAERYLALDTLAEDIHRRLIWLYAAIGNRPAALRQFEHCALILERELGVDVLPETRQVYETIRDQAEPAAAEVHRASWASESADRFTAKPLYGRQAETAFVQALLAANAPRLITLSGPGGSGKTHLARHIAAAASFPDSVIWVELASLRMPALLLNAIAYACGVREASAGGVGTPLLKQLQAALQPKHMLLVLDNLEHLLDAAGVIGDILAAAPRLRVLATSRAALNLPGEQVVPVPPLPVPNCAALPPLADLAAQPAVALLIGRVQERNPAFALTEKTAADLAAICVRLDGLPLALELAAARLISLPPHALLARLNHRLNLLTRGPRHLPERHQTLRATIDWSYHLLDLETQAIFAGLAVFAGGWTLDAAAAVVASGQFAAAPVDEMAALDYMDSLIAHNLAYAIPGDEPRFGMLETLREYALEQLTARGWAAAAAASHAAFYRALATDAAQHFQDPDTSRWLALLEREYDNLRLALAWSLERPEGAESALDIADTLQLFWRWRSDYPEASHWIARVLAHSRGLRSAKYIHLLMIAGSVAAFLGDQDTAMARFTEGLECCKDVEAPEFESTLLINVARIYGYRGQITRACETFEAALLISRNLENPQHLVMAIRNLASMLCGGLVDLERGMDLFDEGLAIARESSSGIYNQATLAVFLADFGYYLAMAGQPMRAKVLLAEALDLAERSDHTVSRFNLLSTLGRVALMQGDREGARGRFLASQQLIGDRAAPLNTVGNIEGLAELAMATDAALATRLLAAAAAARAQLHVLFEPIEQPYQDQLLASLRGRLGGEQFFIAWQSGGSWSIDQAIAAAIDAATQP